MDIEGQKKIFEELFGVSAPGEAGAAEQGELSSGTDLSSKESKAAAGRLPGRPGAAAESGKIYTFPVGEDSYIHAVKLWPGIVLWANEINLYELSFPVDFAGRINCIIVNQCHLGRCEVQVAEGRFVYMSPGLVNVTDDPRQSGYYYPSGAYEGIEIYFDMDVLGSNVPPALFDYGLNTSVLAELAERGSVMAKVSAASLARGKRIYEELCRGEAGLEELRFETLSLMYHLVHGEATKFNYGMLVTGGQRRIVKEAEQLMTEDFRRRYTIDELAERFGISTSAFKKYFVAVYGLSVSQYMRERRMEAAEKFLAETKKSVGEIAQICGYEHQGKFGEVFKEHSGVTPLEYRRLNRKL